MPGMEAENSNASRAEELKQLANEAFKGKFNIHKLEVVSCGFMNNKSVYDFNVFSGHKYSQAIDLYTQAIELNGENAVYYANRAFAHSKLEEYGSAIQDGTRAIEIDPRYSKVSI